MTTAFFHEPGQCEDADCYAHSAEDDDYPPPVYGRDGLHVMAESCSTCIFRPGNLMNLNRGRLKDMNAACDADDTNVICHQTLSQPIGALCRGSVDRRAGQMVRIAERLGALVEIAPEKGVRDGPTEQ